MKSASHSASEGVDFQARAPRASARPADMKSAGRNAANGTYFQARDPRGAPRLAAMKRARGAIVEGGGRAGVVGFCVVQ